MDLQLQFETKREPGNRRKVPLSPQYTLGEVQNIINEAIETRTGILLAMANGRELKLQPDKEGKLPVSKISVLSME